MDENEGRFGLVVTSHRFLRTAPHLVVLHLFHLLLRCTHLLRANDKQTELGGFFFFFAGFLSVARHTTFHCWETNGLHACYSSLKLK